MRKFLVILFATYFTFFSSKNILADKIISWIPTYKVGVTYYQSREIALIEKESFLPESRILDIPLINQMDEPQLKNGCEVTSLAMILNASGLTVTKNELAEKITKVPLNYPDGLKGNPTVGFVGDMAVGPGLSVYNGPIFYLAKEYVGEKAVNLTNSPFEDLLRKVGRGIPVWVLTTMDFEPDVEFREWSTPQGPIKITLSGHSAVITGYDKDFIYVNDPYGYKNRKIDRTTFISVWEVMGKQAIAIEI
jgi:uncharacterized protein YvpB